MVCMAGRPAQPMSREAQTAYYGIWNVHHNASEVPSCSRIGCYFVARCGLHLTYHTPDYIKRQPIIALDCRQCAHDAGVQHVGNDVSRYESLAWRIVRSLFLGHMLVEVSILGGRLGKADIWLPYDTCGQLRLNLIIQVDGEGHTCYSMRGRSVAVQQDRDERFNTACWQQGRRLLRLHHADKLQWPQFVQFAIQECRTWPGRSFAWFTDSYQRASVYAD